MSDINFFQEEVSFQLNHEDILKGWISTIIQNAKQSFDTINFIYCSDNYLLEIYKEYLDHDYYTDIITFDNREDDESALNADIFISIDRVKENAGQLNLLFEQELHRVMVHGVLHLLGLKDKTEAQKKEMRESEEASLSLLHI